jgi:hypothetical protein
MEYRRSSAVGRGLARSSIGLQIILAITLISACAEPAPREQVGQPLTNRARDTRALVMAIRYEPVDLATKTASQSGSFALKRLFNAYIALVDGTGEPQP